ncbi:hypothetical protein UXO42_08600 [Enterobacter quasihormaechei]|uniref:hypothetical protein n=1 Tax=Enterobacter quasihormaechei TaxID=2529382 RepID=UPI002FD35942
MSVKRYEWVSCDEHACHCDVVESAEGDMVDYEDYAALEARCAALAAENALMKKSEPAPFSKLMMEALDVYQAGADEVPELAMLSAYKKLRDGLKTPATDAFLAEVRAQGVEMCSAEIQKQTWDEREGDGMVAAIDAMEIYAALLRKGVQS